MKKKATGSRGQRAGSRICGKMFLLVIFCAFLLAGCGGGGGGDTPTTPGTTASKTTVSIVSDPSGMSVYLNDDLKGTTPFFSETISPGAYTLKLVPPNGAEALASTHVAALVVTQGQSNYYPYTPTPDSSTASQPTIDWGKR